MTNRTVRQLVLSLSILAFAECGTTGEEPSPHLVTFISGDIVASPQSLSGTVGEGKADLSGTLEATYNFDKWIANCNDGDPAAFQILKEAQIAAGGSLTGTAEIAVDASSAVNSYIEVSVPAGETSYTVKIYTCVDYPHTTVTETATSIDVSQTGGTACAYRWFVYSVANEGGANTIRIHLLFLSLYQTCQFREVSFLEFLLSEEKDVHEFANSGRARKVIYTHKSSRAEVC